MQEQWKGWLEDVLDQPFTLSAARKEGSQAEHPAWELLPQPEGEAISECSQQCAGNPRPFRKRPVQDWLQGYRKHVPTWLVTKLAKAELIFTRNNDFLK